MGIIDTLVDQSGNPTGALGRLMVRIMNKMDSGLNNWVLEKTGYPMERLLEVGCGGGQTIAFLLRNSKIDHIVGVDYSVDAVRVAIKKNSQAVKGGRVAILQESVVSLPFPQNHFDTVLAVRSHYFWPDLESAFRELFRTLRPSGKMLIFSETFKIQYHMKEFHTDDAMEALLQVVGFRNVLIENKQGVQCITASK